MRSRYSSNFLVVSPFHFILSTELLCSRRVACLSARFFQTLHSASFSFPCYRRVENAYQLDLDAFAVSVIRDILIHLILIGVCVLDIGFVLCLNSRKYFLFVFQVWCCYKATNDCTSCEQQTVSMLVGVWCCLMQQIAFQYTLKVEDDKHYNIT